MTLSMYEEIPFWLKKYLNLLNFENLHHAFLISGRKGVGKDHLIRYLSCITLCAEDDELICGKCNSCKFSGLDNHPDFHEMQILPEKKLIGISQVHELRNKLYESSFLGKNKVAFLPNIEKISTDGLNALLKILEEPPANTFFFLSTSFLNQIPPTILSRCIEMKINAPSAKDAVIWLSDYPKDDVIKSLQLNDYLPFATKDFLDKGMIEIRNDFIKDISGIIKKGKNLISISDKWIKDETSLTIKLEWMSLILRDAIKFNADQSIESLNEDTDKISKYLGDKSNIEKIHLLLSQTNSLWNLLSRDSNLRKDYQLNSLFINWEGELGISKKA
tara:strand:- start:477 stop:1472 length:996 start_codon:yes stop_codon:yes gene_type:complete